MGGAYRKIEVSKATRDKLAGRAADRRGDAMTTFAWFVLGFVLCWPIAVCHGIDLERRWRR